MNFWLEKHDWQASLTFSVVRVRKFPLKRFRVLAAVTSELLTIVKTKITIVSYFGNVTASLFALTIVSINLPSSIVNP